MDLEVTDSSYAPLVQLPSFPWIPQDTGQYLCVQVSDRAQQFFQVLNPSGALGLRWPFAALGAMGNTVFLSLNRHEFFEEEQKQNPEQNPSPFP